MKMGSWTYFRWVCVIWGALALLTKPVLFNLLGESWRSFLKRSAYKEGGRPGWVYAAAVGSFLLIGYTWVRVYTDPVSLDWALGILMTVSSVKITALMVDYTRFQSWVTKVLTDSAREQQMIIQVSAAGVILILMGLLLY